MLDQILNAAINWVQRNPDHTAYMGQQLFRSIKGSLPFGRSKVELKCPVCGQKWEMDESLYNSSLCGKMTKCTCGAEFKCL